MIKYGAERWSELTFAGFAARIEKKPQWMDIYLELVPASDSAWPDDLSDPGALAICAYDGTVIEIVAQDGGCDSEYQFTEGEKAQIASYVEQLLGRAPISPHE